MKLKSAIFVSLLALCASTESFGASVGAFSQTSGAPTSGGYCLAVRGNGELAAAHWGAIARVVEKNGLPQAMSGGSSASITLFLLESIAQNPVVTGLSIADRRDSASLLLKSLQGYLEMVAARPEWQELAQLAHFLKGEAGQKMMFVAWLKIMVDTKPEALTDFVLQNRLKILKSLEYASEVGVINLKTLVPLYVAIGESGAAKDEAGKTATAKRVQFLAGELYSSVTLLGKFNAETDQNLFFRPGVVDFKKLAKSFGRLANFYAGREMNFTQVQELTSYISACAPLARDKTWDELRSTNPECDSRFKKIAAGYVESGLPQTLNSRELDRVGAFIPSFPGTAVLRDSAYADAKRAMALYPLAMSSEFGKSFRVKSDDIAFGYWGPAKALSRIEKNLATPFKDVSGRVWDFSKDAKSIRFYGLGDESWAQVLSTSPAEPGLAPLQEITTATGSVYSAGGWSDLHPGAVLKAAGCDNVVYVTRRGGESLFGQGVAKRLLGFDDIPWDMLATDPVRKPRNKIKNNNGDSQDMKSDWSRLYNMANADSSFSRALDIFDSVVCTDWDRFDITQTGAISGMIAEAYRAPWVSKKTASPKDFEIDAKLGFRPYAGCLPQK